VLRFGGAPSPNPLPCLDRGAGEGWGGRAPASGRPENTAAIGQKFARLAPRRLSFPRHLSIRWVVA